MATKRSRVEIVLEAVDRAVGVIDRSVRAYDKLARSQQKNNKLTERSNRLQGRSIKIMGRLKTQVLALVAAFATFTAVQGALNPSIQMEQFEAEFSVLLGSIDHAQKRIGELSDFAAGTPFELPNIVRASRTLETLTRGALSTGDGLRMVGDVAAGTGQPIDELAVHFGRLYDGLQNGTPVGESMARLQELGVISAGTRRRIEALQKEGRKGDDVWGVAASAFSRFSGLMEVKSRTLAGQLSNVSDNFFNLRAQFGEGVRDSLTPVINDINEALGKLFDSEFLTKVGNRVGDFITLVYQEWQAGRIDELIQLTVLAGWEAAMDGVKKLFVFRVDNEGEIISFFSGIGLSFSQVIVNAAIKASRTTYELFFAAIDNISKNFVPTFQNLTKQVKNFIVVVFNALIGQIQGILNSSVAFYNSVNPFGEDKSAPQLKTLKEDLSPDKPLKDFATSLSESEQKLGGFFDTYRNFINDRYEETRKILELEKNGAITQESALKRLKTLLDEIAAKRLASGNGNVTDPTQVLGGKSGDDKTEPSFTDTLGLQQSAVDGLSTSMQGLVFQTLSWRNALINVASTVTERLVKSFADMAAEYIVSNLIIQGQMKSTSALGSLLKQKETSETVAQEGVKQAAMTPTAMLASIGSFGVAVAIGLAALTAVLAGFETGGYTGNSGKSQVAGVVHGREFVNNAQSTAVNRPFLEYANSGGRLADLFSGGSQRAVQGLSSTATAVNLNPAFAGNTSASQNNRGMTLIQPKTENEFRRAVELAITDDMVIDKIQRNRAKLGIPG